MIGAMLLFALSNTAHGGISLYGDGDGYDSHDRDWLSNTIDDIDSNGLGTDGYIFFGDFVAEGANTGWGSNSDITAISSTLVTDVLPTYVSAASMGADCNSKIGNFASYEAIDNPLVGDGTDGPCGNIVVNGDEALDFTVSGLPAGTIVRVGVVTVLNDDARARFDAPVISLTDGTDTVSATNLPNLSGSGNSDGPGWVFFDLDSDGDYTILIPNGSATDDGANSATAVNGLGGVTFDTLFVSGPGAALLFAPGGLSLDLDAPSVSTSGIIRADYYPGQITSNDIEILSLVADSGFSASVVDDTLGLGDTTEDILVAFAHSGTGLVGGESLSSTLEVTWSEIGSGMSHTTHLPLEVTYNDPIVGLVDIDEPEEDWFFFDYDAASTFSSSDPSEYSVDVADGSQDQIFPAEIQQFASGFDLSQIGQKLTAEFDVVMHSSVGSFDKDFRFGFFDTSENVQIISMNDLGPISGSYMSLKLGDQISYNNGNGGVFVNGDYATLSILYGSTFDSDSGTKTNGLVQNELNQFKHSIERVGENELHVQTVWSDTVSTSTSQATLDETTGASGVGEYIPSGGYQGFDGFGLQIHERFSGADYTLSNFRLTYTIPLRASFEFGVSAISIHSSGDVTLTLSNPLVGASYRVRASDDLLDWDEVGSYLAEDPGVIVLPAGDFSAFVGDKGFFQLELLETPTEE